MPPRKSPSTTSTTDYRYDAIRRNNPPVGRKRYVYDSRLDSMLHWVGKIEHLTFDVEMGRCTSTSASRPRRSTTRCAVARSSAGCSLTQNSN